jgi:hypothetical protein
VANANASYWREFSTDFSFGSFGAGKHAPLKAAPFDAQPEETFRRL